MTDLPTLWHYTCDHGRQGLGPAGTLLALAQLEPERSLQAPYDLARLVWLTDLDTCWPEALGLTSRSISCDRTLYRYRATDQAGVTWWPRMRRQVDPYVRQALESAPGARPMHWYTALGGTVPVVYDPA